jgi:hypothetical protein
VVARLPIYALILKFRLRFGVSSLLENSALDGAGSRRFLFVARTLPGVMAVCQLTRFEKNFCGGDGRFHSGDCCCSWLFGSLVKVPGAVIAVLAILLMLIMGGSRLIYRAWKERRLYGLESNEAKLVLILEQAAPP